MTGRLGKGTEDILKHVPPPPAPYTHAYTHFKSLAQKQPSFKNANHLIIKSFTDLWHYDILNAVNYSSYL